MSPRCASSPARHLVVALALIACAIPARAHAYGEAWALIPANPALPTSSVAFYPNAYDPVRERMLLGVDDLWALSLTGSPTWTPVANVGSPPVAKYPSVIYDPVNDQLVYFGGQFQNGTTTNAVYTLSLGGTPTWTLLTPSGTPPTGRVFNTAIYDSPHHRMVVFGGESSGSFTSDVWALDLDGPPAWEQLLPSGSPPGARTRAKAVYDAAGQRMVMFGGYGASGFLGDVWSLSLGASPAWQSIATHAGPDARDNHCVVMDDATRRLIVFGGNTGINVVNDVWALDLAASTWQQLSAGTARFPGSNGGLVVYDPVGARLVNQIDGTWTFALDPDAAEWSPLVLPAGPFNAQPAVDDPVHHQMIIVDGGVWELPLEQPSPRWTKVFPSGAAPAEHASAVGVWDSGRNRMLVFGGNDALNALSAFAPDPPAWTALTTSGSLPGTNRILPGLVYDAPGDRLVLFGGNATDSVVYELPLSGPNALRWNALATAGTSPGPRRAGSMVFDPLLRRAVLMGGVSDFDPMHAPRLFDDLWTLDLSGTPMWTSWNIPTRPGLRAGHMAALDPIANRMLVFGGYKPLASLTYNDLWGLNLADMTWAQLAPAGGPPSPRRYVGAALDPDANRLAIYGGSDGSDTWFLDYTAMASVGGSPQGVGLRLEHVAFDRASGELRARLALPDERPATITVFDLSGRVIARRAVSRRDGPEFRMGLPRIPAGMYFVDLSQSGRRTTARLAVLR